MEGVKEKHHFAKLKEIFQLALIISGCTGYQQSAKYLRLLGNCKVKYSTYNEEI